MKRTVVESSRMLSIGWEAGTLEIEFKGGAIYQYKGVPEQVYKDLLEAPSKGKFFHENIRNDFPAEKILAKIVE